jgi:hypothetical protein
MPQSCSVRETCFAGPVTARDLTQALTIVVQALANYGPDAEILALYHVER